MREMWERIFKIKGHYRNVFTTVSGQRVLSDLTKFCRWGQSPLVVSSITQQSDPMATGIAIGRQEVLSRIQHMLNVDDANMLKLKGMEDE